ncbi:isocitrate lyase/PEP mutase family protein [Ohtaekwangia koreensis]|uniref:2-Methylisocitrate lyase, PEP mutase family n=1 Tax=Ohtaekwangia koreensis TaxID=688867 RepID=A0A1T5MB62_9BACT|nr:isocitrate lyase/phosphoenolpyruvate mutase family protein [Ohtaekwangia koreensis]SKC85487.1 2-Methylisocitrate lyase, PEP mutase family [Ohtaekwangia koreensis]
MNSFETFSQLHHQPNPLLIGNIWDVNSAKTFERIGFKAIGTSSAAVANSFGYDDGERLPFDILLRLAKRVADEVHIPFSVDMEAGYSRTTVGIIENIEKLHDVGVAGINLEDTLADKSRQLQPVNDFQKAIAAITEYIIQKNMKIFLNIRTDGFLLGMPTALTETVKRIKRYEAAGANGIFVPCITAESDIKEVLDNTSLPLNVMCMPDLPDFDVLKSLGVKRISMGNFVHGYINKKLEDIGTAIFQDQSFASLFQNSKVSN